MSNVCSKAARFIKDVIEKSMKCQFSLGFNLEIPKSLGLFCRVDIKYFKQMMIELFDRGEPIYMVILTILFLVIVSMSLVIGILIYKRKVDDGKRVTTYLSLTRSVGLFTLVFGIFTQLLGLYGAFAAIEEWGSASPGILSAGLWTSSIPSLYGLIIFSISYLLWYALARWFNKVINVS